MSRTASASKWLIGGPALAASMRFAATLALPLLALAFAGCTGGGGTVAAHSNLSIANAKAHEIDGSAALVDVAGLEVTDTKPLDDALAHLPPEAQDAVAPVRALIPRSDSSPGDGAAPAWGYVFAGSAGVTFIAVDASGSVTYAKNVPGEAPSSASSSSRFSDWSVDSDQAAMVVSKSSAGFRDLASNKQAIVTYDLRMSTNTLVWDIFAGSGSFSLSGPASGMMHFRVDATTGQMLNTTNVLPPTPSFLPREGASDTGSLNAAQPSATADFTVSKTGHEKLVLLLQQGDQAAVGTDLRAKVTAPDGKTYDLKVSGAVVVLGQGSDKASAPTPPAGDYKVAISLAAGLTADYTFAWCTDGAGTISGNAGLACN